jgi:intracellular multiplication protein IcmB
MMNIMDSVVDSLDTLLSWISLGLKQSTFSYCDLETAEDKTTLVGRDGSLITILKIQGSMKLVGSFEFERLHQGVKQSLEATLSRTGHAVQVFFSYDKEAVRREIEEIFLPARQTAKNIRLNLDDLFKERIKFLSQYCAKETFFFVLWTRPASLTKDQMKRAMKDKHKYLNENKIPPFKDSQYLLAAIPDLRTAHDAFVRSTLSDLNALELYSSVLNVHDALREVKMTIDPEFTSNHWRPVLPGDKIPVRHNYRFPDDISNVLYPTLAMQLFTREAERLDLRTVRIGDRAYTSIFIDLFPNEIKPFMHLFHRIIPTQIPWRISYMLESDGLRSLQIRSTLAAILSFTSPQNRLLADAIQQLREISINAEDAVVRLKVVLTTWAPADDIRLLRDRTSQLAKAVQGWGNCEISEISGDPFGGVVSSMLGVTAISEANATAAPLSDVVYMLPLTRPASPWKSGAVLFRSPDGKPWPYQPGSTLQTTWIDLFYARPGSGKSVLSNSINLALCLSGGLKRLPRIAIIDIGPSSSGLISLLKEALPPSERHYVAYHRLRMTEDFSINPCDTQLGARYPTPQERSFLVNFITLLATPVGKEKPYDAIPDMAGMIVDEMYKALADDGRPYTYTAGIETVIDEILNEIGFVQDQHTTWWEITDALFLAGFTHEAMLAQRYAAPLIADAASIVRSQAVQDLYGEIIAPTGESLIDAFSRMISSAVREYPLLSRVTQFDLGEAKIVSLDLDEVAKTGGEAADKQTAVMYMLARYVLAKHYYMTEENVKDMPLKYQAYHATRVKELREDPKRIVYDEFHRTSRAQAVREQVIVDMREGRKWKVQVALVSQSLDDFDSVMIEFATSVYIMDAGPKQSIDKTAEIFGLSETAKLALATKVHGPREGGSTLLAQFATKQGVNTQLLTSTIGPIELWAFSTTAEDVKLRNILYTRLGPVRARWLLARLFPTGSATKLIEERLHEAKTEIGLIAEINTLSIVDQLAEEIIENYNKNPQVKTLVR